MYMRGALRIGIHVTDFWKMSFGDTVNQIDATDFIFEKSMIIPRNHFTAFLNSVRDPKKNASGFKPKDVFPLKHFDKEAEVDKIDQKELDMRAAIAQNYIKNKK